MKMLRIIKAKPNPRGKDRHGPFTPASQLAAEWLDFKNDGNEDYSLVGIELNHIAFQPVCRDGKWQEIMSFKGILEPGKVVRIHSGQEIPLTDMNPEDAQGADFHLFTGRNYVWNNDCGDSAGLWDGTKWIDTASYDPYPPEGVILHRVGEKLVPQGLGLYKF
jgi:hypothetical protein